MPRLARFLAVSFCAVLVLHFATISVRALDTTLPPSGHFDLIAWKITLPDQTEIKEQQLSSGFESTDDFCTDPVAGGMVPKCPNNGAIGGSHVYNAETSDCGSFWQVIIRHRDTMKTHTGSADASEHFKHLISSVKPVSTPTEIVVLSVKFK